MGLASAYLSLKHITIRKLSFGYDLRKVCELRGKGRYRYVRDELYSFYSARKKEK
jgi:hypothetical protein